MAYLLIDLLLYSKIKRMSQRINFPSTFSFFSKFVYRHPLYSNIKQIDLEIIKYSGVVRGAHWAIAQRFLEMMIIAQC